MNRTVIFFFAATVLYLTIISMLEMKTYIFILKHWWKKDRKRSNRWEVLKYMLKGDTAKLYKARTGEEMKDNKYT